MDPSAEEIADFATIDQIFEWAGVDAVVNTSFYDQTGTLVCIRELASLDYADVVTSVADTVIQVVGITDVDSGTAANSFRKLRPVEKTRLFLARRAARLRCALPPDNPTSPAGGGIATGSVGPPPQAQMMMQGGAQSPSSNSSGVELGSVWDQSSLTHIQLMGAAAVTKLYERYRVIRGSVPHPDSECTELQLSAVKQVMDAGLPPAADFAVFGLHGSRLMRKLHFTATFLDGQGRQTLKELPGPPSYEAWWASFKPYRTALVMFDIADTEHLDNYAEFIKKLDSSWNSRFWFLVVMADFRMRSENFERIRRNLELQHAQLSSAHEGIAAALTSFDPGRPWNEVFRVAVSDKEFWDK